MNWRLLLLCLILYGCRYVPPAPSFDFGGIMTIRVIEPADPGFEYIRGIFKVEGKEERFSIYFQDDLNMPRGMVIVEDGKVIEEDIPIKEKSIRKVFRYWPYLFGSGKKTPKKIGIEYLGWKKISGHDLPCELNVAAADIMLNIKINYGN